MNCYEHTFIAKQDLPESQNKKLVEKYENIIKKNSGKVIKCEEWGLRNLTYKIYHHINMKVFCPVFLNNRGGTALKNTQCSWYSSNYNA